jgi:SHS2 domain-containing protein
VTAEIDRHPVVRRLRHGDGAPLRQAPSGTPLPPVAVPIESGLETGIEARAADLRVLFEEAAHALLRVTPHPDPAGPASRWETVSLRAADLPGLAGAWLDRLIALGDSRLSDERREAIVMVAVDRVAPPDEDAQYGRWQLRARVGLRPYQPTASAPTREVRTASDRPLAVEGAPGGWTLRAQLAF